MGLGVGGEGGGGRGVTFVPSLSCKTCRLAYLGGRHVAVRILLLYLRFSLLLSKFQPNFVSFFAISGVLCHCFEAMSLVRITPNRARDQALYRVQGEKTAFFLAVSSRFLAPKNIVCSRLG